MERLRRRKPGRPLSFDREVALGNALRLFWAQGYEGTSIADLTSAMDITPPSLYAAFGSKAELYREVLTLYQRGPGRYAAEALSSEGTTRTAILRLLQGAARQFASEENPHGCMIANAVLGCAPEHRQMARAVAGLRAQNLKGIEERLKRAVREDELGAGTNPSVLARFVGAMIQGMSVQARDGASQEDLKAVAEFAVGALPFRETKNTKARTDHINRPAKSSSM
jgi:AcrR family transcriptional regulator